MIDIENKTSIKFFNDDRKVNHRGYRFLGNVYSFIYYELLLV